MVLWHQGFYVGGAVCQLCSDLAWTQSHDLLQALALGISNSGCFGPLIPGDLQFSLLRNRVDSE